jgi:Domain of unknown function (DUF4288)
MARYAANLLLEYRVKEAPSPRPLCEKRIVVFEASHPREAIHRAKQHGKRGELSYRNADDQTVQIRFIGLIDVISLEACEDDEAYYSLSRISDPARHVRPDARLSVLASGSKAIGSSWWAVPKTLVGTKTKRRRRTHGA